MQITINGQAKDLPPTGNISNIVAQFCKNPKHVIAEVNGQIIPHTNWDGTLLKEGDAIELVAFVGGG